jgi:hypothetical protein
MALNELTLQFAEITAVDEINQTVSAQSRMDGSVITKIPIDCPLMAQFIPVVGQQVLLIRIAEYGTRILAVFGEKVFNAPLKSGEVMVEGAGGAFMYLNRGGDAMLSDAAMSNVLKMLSSVGIQMIGDALEINIKKMGRIKIMDDKVEIVKISGDSKEPKTQVTLTDDTVEIGAAKINLGNSATNPLMGGCVHSMSGVQGPHSFCMITGAPIPASGSVKVES